MRRALALTLGLCAALSAACFGTGPQLREGDDAGPTGTDLTDKDGGARFDVDLGESFSLVGLVPSHGPFSGGTRTVLNGRGFSSRLRVWVGGVEVAKSAIFASDPTRAALTTPAHAAGAVDVRIKDEGTAEERVLKDGFIYDALDVVPKSGATTGGTRVAVHGSGTAFVTGSLVGIDGKDCTDVVVTSPTELECTTPAERAGLQGRRSSRCPTRARSSRATRSPTTTRTTATAEASRAGSSTASSRSSSSTRTRACRCRAPRSSRAPTRARSPRSPTARASPPSRTPS